MAPHEDDRALDKRNGGEESMQSFIRHHLVATLQPISENVRELQQQLQHVSKDLALTDAKVEQSKASLDHHDRELLTLRGSNGQLTARVDRALIELSKEAEERGRLERDLGATKDLLAKTNERQQHSTASVEGVERKVLELDALVEACRLGLSKTDKSAQQQSKSLAQLKDAHDDLAVRHEDANRRLSQAAQSGEIAERELQKFVKGRRHQADEDSRVITGLTLHLNGLQAATDATHELAEQLAQDLQRTGSHVQQLKAVLDHSDGSSRRLEQLQARNTETADALKKHIDRFERLETCVEQLGDGLAAARQPVGSSHGEVIDDLKFRLENNTSDIAKLAKTQLRHGDHIKEVLTATERLQREHVRVQEQAAHAEREVLGVVASHKQTAAKVDTHSLEQQRIQADLQQVAAELDSGLHQVKGDLGSTTMTLSKLKTNFDACNQNMFGLAKGFQDAHRHVVASETGLHSPKVTRPNSLPLIPPRTPRGTLAPRAHA